MVRASAVAVCAALVTLSPRYANAQELIERLRLQGGYLTQASPGQQRQNDILLAATPELTLFWETPDSRSNLTYALTGSLRTSGGTTELSHRLTYAQIMRIGQRTTLSLSASANETSLSNLLVSTPFATNVQTNSNVLPSASTKFVGGDVRESLQYEIDPQLLLSESTGASVTTTLAPSAPLDTLTADTGLAIERLFQFDAIGAQTRATYVAARSLPPTPDRDYVYIDVGPRWRHDWSQEISSQLDAGATFLVTTPRNVYPLGRLSLRYAPTPPRTTGGPPVAGTAVELAGSTGVAPNPLSGIITRTHEVRLLAQTPLSEKHQVLAHASIGYGHSDLIDASNVFGTSKFDSISTETGIDWQINEYIGTFARYQFVGQIGDSTRAGGTNLATSFLRDQWLIGVTFASRPPDFARVGTTGGLRVDGSDVPASQLNQQSPGGETRPGEEDWGRKPPNTNGVDDGSDSRFPGTRTEPLPREE